MAQGGVAYDHMLILVSNAVSEQEPKPKLKSLR